MKSIRPLLYLDFLGFSNNISLENLETSLERYEYILREQSYLDHYDLGIKFAVVSDSVFIWCTHEDVSLSLQILAYVASTHLHNLLSEKTGHFAKFGHNYPVRGVLTIDQFIIGNHKFHLFNQVDNKKVESPIYTDNFTILGKAIIKAAEWEKSQKWIGISIHPNDISLFDSLFQKERDELVNKNLLVDWWVPTDQGLIRTLAVNPLAQGLHHADWLIDSLEKSKVATNIHNRPKYNATINFLEHIKEKRLGEKMDREFYKNLKARFNNAK